VYLPFFFSRTAPPLYQIYHVLTQKTITVKPSRSGKYEFYFDGKTCMVPVDAEVGKAVCHEWA
jgi:hypothetical protein